MKEKLFDKIIDIYADWLLDEYPDEMQTASQQIVLIEIRWKWHEFIKEIENH